MTIAFVTSSAISNNAASGSSVAHATGVNPTVGHTLIVSTYWSSATVKASNGITSTKGNVFTLAGRHYSPSQQIGMELWYTRGGVTVGGAADTLTANWSSSVTAPEIIFGEYSGLDTVNPFVNYIAGEGVGGSNPATASSGSLTSPATGNALFFSTNGQGSKTSAGETGWNVRILNTVNTFDDCYEDLIVTTQTTAAATSTINNSLGGTLAWVQQLLILSDVAQLIVVPEISTSFTPAPDTSHPAYKQASAMYPFPISAVAVPTQFPAWYPERLQQPHRAGLETAFFIPPPVVAARLSDAAPIGAKTSYPDTVLAAPGVSQQHAWSFRPMAPERTSTYVDQDFPDRVPRAAPVPQYPDVAARPLAPERTSPFARQDYPDAVRLAPPVAQQQDAAARPVSPERTSPMAAQSYPDRVPAAQPREPGFWVTQRAPERTSTLAPQDYPDRVRPALAVAQQQAAAAIPLAPEVRAPGDWRTSYPDTVRAAAPVAQQRENAGAVPLAPERTASYIAASYPDRLDGAPFPARLQASLDVAPLPIPNTAAPISAYASYPDRFPRLGGLPNSQQQDWAARNLPPLVVVRNWDLTSYPATVPGATRVAQPFDATQVPPLPRPNTASPTVGYWAYPDQVLRPGGFQAHQQQAFTGPVRPEAKLPTPYTAYPERVPGSPFPATEQQHVAALPARPEAPAPSDWYASYPETVRGRSLPTSQQQDTAARPMAPELKTPRDWATWYPDRVDGRPFPVVQQQAAAALGPRLLIAPAAPASYPDIVYGRAFPPNAQQAFTISPQALIPPTVPAYFRNDYPDIVRAATLPTAIQPWTSSWFHVVVEIDYLVVITLVASQAAGDTLDATEPVGLTLDPTEAVGVTLDTTKIA